MPNNYNEQLEGIKQKALDIQSQIPTATDPTVGDTYKQFNAPAPDVAYDTAAKEMGNYYQQQASQPISEKQVYRDQLRKYQAQIDATNQIYKDQLRQAQIAGMGRLGSQTAMAARSGTLGSDFGAAQENKVREYNSGIQGDIRNELNLKIAEIMGTARKGAADEIAAKRLAKQQGAESYLKYLGSKTERRTAGLSKLASSLISQGLSPEDIDPKVLEQIAGQYGVSADEIKASYFDAKKASDAAAAASDLATRKTESEISKNNRFTLSEGEALIDPATGKVISKNAKTFAPNSDTAGGLNPYQTFNATQSLKKTTQANTNAARELKRQGNILDQTWNRYQSGDAADLNATTQAIVTTFNKILDPDSVVRETEYDRSASGQALLSTIEGKIAAISQGGPGLTPESLKELVDLGKKYTANAEKSIAEANKRAREEAQFFGLNPDFVVTADGAASEPAGGTVDGMSDDEAYQLYLETLNGSN